MSSFLELFKYKMQMRSDSENEREAAAKHLGLLGDPKVLDLLVRTLSDKGPGVRRAAAVSLGQLKDPKAIDPLIASMKDKGTNPAMRRAIVTSLGQIGDAKSIPVLLASLRDVDMDLRKAASESLVLIGSPAVEYLIELMSCEDEHTRKEAISMLGKIKDQRAVPKLAKLMHEGGSDRSDAANALNIMGWKPSGPEDRALFAFVRGKFDEPVAEGKAMVAPLIAIKNDPSNEVRRAVANALGKIADPRSVPALIEMSKDDNPEVRESVARALGVMKDPSSLDALIELLNDPEQYVRPAAARSLGLLKDGRALEPLMALLNDKKYALRKTAAESLASLGTISVEPLIDELINGDPASKPFVAEALGFLRDKRAVRPLCMALIDRDPAIRRDAAKALGMIGDPEAADALSSLLHDEQPEVWQMVTKALARFGDGRAVGRLVEMADNETIAANIVETITKILQHKISDVSDDDLIKCANLKDILQERAAQGQMIGNSVDKLNVDCTTLNGLAKSELAKRGLM
ncbi:MAG: HEAT repeat domain-containing protein [bacterium]